jgi:hypothetical protein
LLRGAQKLMQSTEAATNVSRSDDTLFNKERDGQQR